MEGFQINYEVGSTVKIPFSSVDSAGASVTLTTDGTLELFKGSSETPRSSNNGITLIEDHSGDTGTHMVLVDTSDTTVAGYYEVGETYSMKQKGMVVDSQTVNHWIGHFALGQLVGAGTTALSNASVVAIVNAAFIELGEPTITSITDDVKAARLANNIFAATRDEVLEDYPWKSAREMVSLALLTTTPAWGWTNQFQLPTDYIRMVQTGNSSARFQIQGRKILTDEAAFDIEYIKRITDPNEMSPMLKDAIASRLAAKLSLPLTGSGQRQEAMWQIYRTKISQARHSDATQRNDDVIETNDWLDSRNGGETNFRPISS